MSTAEALTGFERFAAQLGEQTPAAIVLGAERAHGLAITRSLGRRGVPVVLLGSSGSPGMKSRFGFPLPIDGLGPEQLVARLLQLGEMLPTRGVLLPTRDAHVLLLSRHAEALARCFRFTPVRADILEALADKRLQYGLAARHGIPTPRTLSLERAGDLDRVPGEIGFPCVLKPAYSDEWSRYRSDQPHGSQPGKVLVAHDREQLARAYARLTAVCQGVCAQELIAGGADQLYAVYAHCEPAGTPSALFVRRKWRDWPVDFGSGTYSESVVDPQAEALARRLLGRIGYRGLANIEFKRDPRDGALKMIEFNVRGASQLALAVDSGVDLPFAAYSALAGNVGDATRPMPQRAGVRWIDFGTDALSARAQRRRGGPGFLSWVGDVLRARSFAYFAADDLRPALARTTELMRGFAAALTARGAD